MRVVSSFADVNIVIKPLQDFISLFKTKDTDRHGLRLKNNGDAVDPQDYVTLKQLNTGSNTVQTVDQYYTIVFSFGGVPSGGSAIPNWVTGINRDGIPIQVWGKCGVAPVGGPFVFNVLLNGVAILTNNISTTGTTIQTSSSFVNPVPQLGLLSTVVPTIISVNTASNITIGLVIKRNG